MLTTVIQKFAQVALVVTVIGGLGLVPFYARDIVEFFASASASATQTDFYPAPIVRAP